MRKAPYLVLLAFLAVGCSGGDSAGNGEYKAPTAAETQKKMADIDADPHMPPQAKAIQKAMLQQNGSGQKSMGGK